MKLLDQLRGLFAPRAEDRSDDDDEAEFVWPGRMPNASGVTLQGDNAYTLSAVWGCVRVIAEALASLPVQVIERAGDSRRVVETHPVHWLLNTSPDDEITAQALRECSTAHALLRGNGYAAIQRELNGQPYALHLCKPDRVRVERTDRGELVYRVRDDNGDEDTVPARDMFHLRGLGYDGIVGYSVLHLARQSLGLSSALESFGAGYFGNGTHPSGVLSTDQALKADQVEQLRAEWEKVHKGGRKANKTAILGGNLKWQPLTVAPEDAQFLESRRFQVLEICRWFRVPPHMLAELERATHTNVEQMSIEFVQNCLLPWVRRFEAEANMKLLGRTQRGRLTVRFNLGGLLRGDLKSRYEAYQIGRRAGWLSVNDVRRLEDMNPVPGGDDYHVESNLSPLELLREKQEKEIEKLDRPDPAPAVAPAPGNDPPPDDADPDNRLVDLMSARLKLINGGTNA